MYFNLEKLEKEWRNKLFSQFSYNYQLSLDENVNKFNLFVREEIFKHLSKHGKVDDEILEEYIEYIKPDFVDTNKLTETTLLKYKDFFNWQKVFNERKVSLNLLREIVKYNNKDWKNFSASLEYDIYSVKDLDEVLPYLNKEWLTMYCYQERVRGFLKKFSKVIYWEKIIDKVEEKFIIENLHDIYWVPNYLFLRQDFSNSTKKEIEKIIHMKKLAELNNLTFTVSGTNNATNIALNTFNTTGIIMWDSSYIRQLKQQLEALDEE